MATTVPKQILAVTYEAAAQDYLRKLPPEHFMEATAQATQRKITLESLDLLKTVRPDVHVFNELLVQYPLPRRRRLGQIVPDNMVVLTDQPIEAETSYNLPLEPAPPFWVIEYVSKNSKRKDYEESFNKYERELKVPYYLVFYPDNQELTLYRHDGERYVAIPPNEQGRRAIPELDLELAILDGWVRFWHKGKLLPLPADLQNELNETRRMLAASERRAEAEAQRAEAEALRAEAEARRAAELARRLEEAERALSRLRGDVPPPASPGGASTH